MTDDVRKEVEQAVEPVMTAFEEYKKVNDQRLAELAKNGEASADTLEKLAKIDAELDKFESVNQKLVEQNEAQKAADESLAEAKGRVDELEARLNRPRAGGHTDEERKQLLTEKVNVWARGVVSAFQRGEANLPEDQQKAIKEAADEYKALVVSDDTTGGYLAPTEFVAQIIKEIVEMSPARQIVSVRSTANKALEVPKRTGTFSAVRVVEHGTRSETTGMSWGMEEITTPETYALVDISEQNLEDSAFDLEAELRMEASEQFAVQEGAEFVSGTGIGQMEGILTNADVATVNSGDANLFTADGLLDLKYSLKTGYMNRGMFIMNRASIGAVRKLVDGNTQYIWQPGLALGRPNTIDGDPYMEFPDMPAESAGNKAAAYGDFRRAYTMVDRVGMRLLRDPYTQATGGNIRFLFRRRFGGKVMLAEAIATQTIAV
jgi:HK97 family phage major capsid protein